MVLDTFKQTDKPSPNFKAYFCSFAFRKRQESKQFNTHNRAFHRLLSRLWRHTLQCEADWQWRGTCRWWFVGWIASTLRGGGDKLLARPGRKQATATKLGIYSTYSPRRSVHFLGRYSNFCKPLKKIQKFVRPTRSPRQQRPPRRTKNGELSICFFQPREQVVVRRGQIRRIGWVVETLDQQRWVILGIDSLALWKIINEEKVVLIPKNRGENFPADFCTRNFWGRVSRYATTPLIVTLCPGHSKITRFRPWPPIATGNHLDRADRIPKVSQTTGTVEVFDPRSGISGPTSRRASVCPNLH